MTSVIRSLSLVTAAIIISHSFLIGAQRASNQKLSLEASTAIVPAVIKTSEPPIVITVNKVTSTGKIGLSVFNGGDVPIVAFAIKITFEDGDKSSERQMVTSLDYLNDIINSRQEGRSPWFGCLEPGITKQVNVDPPVIVAQRLETISVRTEVLAVEYSDGKVYGDTSPILVKVKNDQLAESRAESHVLRLLNETISDEDQRHRLDSINTTIDGAISQLEGVRGLRPESPSSLRFAKSALSRIASSNDPKSAFSRYQDDLARRHELRAQVLQAMNMK